MRRYALRQLSPPCWGRLVLLVVISSVPVSWDGRVGGGVIVGSNNQSLWDVSGAAELLFTFSRMVYPMLSAENISRVVKASAGFCAPFVTITGSVSTAWVEDLSFFCDTV